MVATYSAVVLIAALPVGPAGRPVRCPPADRLRRGAAGRVHRRLRPGGRFCDAAGGPRRPGPVVGHLVDGRPGLVGRRRHRGSGGPRCSARRWRWATPARCSGPVVAGPLGQAFGIRAPFLICSPPWPRCWPPGRCCRPRPGGEGAESRSPARPGADLVPQPVAGVRGADHDVVAVVSGALETLVPLRLGRRRLSATQISVVLGLAGARGGRQPGRGQDLRPVRRPQRSPRVDRRDGAGHGACWPCRLSALGLAAHLHRRRPGHLGPVRRIVPPGGRRGRGGRTAPRDGAGADERLLGARASPSARPPARPSRRPPRTASPTLFARCISLAAVFPLRSLALGRTECQEGA